MASQFKSVNKLEKSHNFGIDNNVKAFVWVKMPKRFKTKNK